LRKSNNPGGITILQRLNFGDFEFTILSDGHYFNDGGAMFGVIPKVLWERKIKADAQNRIEMGLNSLLIRGGKETVLVETGIGPKLPEKSQRIYENEARLLRSFDEAGVAPEDVDVVINTHLHFDHCGWNTHYQGGRAVATFPRARYYVQRGEWEHAQHPNERDYVSYISDNYDPLVASGQMELIAGDREITPGISVRIYPGHTRHMQAVLIHSGGKTACYISDLIPSSHHLDVAWGMAYDLFPAETMEQKKRFHAEAIPNQWLVIFTHDHFLPWAYVAPGKSQGKYVARPVESEVTNSAATPEPSLRVS
jgi:glyoxylase-like metal-dependent hydrolase (beta-lactamase superfamily II)